MLAKEFVKRLSSEIMDFLRERLGLSDEQLAAVGEIRAAANAIVVACDRVTS